MKNENLTPEQVAAQFEEAIETLRKLPGGLGLGFGTAWPEYVHSREERLRQKAKPIKLVALPDEITRLEQVQDWAASVSERERKLLWLRAYKTPWREIAAITGMSKSSVCRLWQTTLRVVASSSGLVCTTG